MQAPPEESLSLSLSLSLYLSLSVSLCISIYLSLSLSSCFFLLSLSLSLSIYLSIYIYIYIYMAVTSIGGQKLAKIFKNAQFYSEKWPRKPPQKRGCFCCIFDFFFLNFFVFFPLFLLISCCFMLFWNPKTAHQVRLQAYIYIYIFERGQTVKN